MSAYRYVVFPRGKQPTVDEVRELQQFAGLLANHFAWGVVRNDGRLALASELRSFDHARSVDAGFDALIGKWEVRGCELVDHLGFVKDAAALRPVATHSRSPHATAAPDARAKDGRVDGNVPRPDEQVAAKRLVAHEAVARSLLGVEHTLARYAAVQRFAAAFPYVLMVAAAAGTIAVGLHIRDRIVNSGPERRQETIERVLNEPSGEGLADEGGS